MNSVNKVILLGHFGQDLTSRTTTNGTPVSNFSVATSKKYKDDAETKQTTQWHRVVCYGKTAELTSQMLRKGSAVYIEGELRTREWDDSDNKKQQTTEVHMTEFSALDKKAA